MVDRAHPLPVTRQVRLLDLSRSSAYYEPVGTRKTDLTLMAAMDAIHLSFPFYVSDGSGMNPGTGVSPSTWARGHADVHHGDAGALPQAPALEAYPRPPGIPTCCECRQRCQTDSLPSLWNGPLEGRNGRVPSECHCRGRGS